MSLHFGPVESHRMDAKYTPSEQHLAYLEMQLREKQQRALRIGQLSRELVTFWNYSNALKREHNQNYRDYYTAGLQSARESILELTHLMSDSNIVTAHNDALIKKWGVAGAAVLMRERYTRMTPQEIRSLYNVT